MAQSHVHVLGLGSICTFTAHSLSEIAVPPQRTLLLHRPSLLKDYLDNKSRVTLHTANGNVIHHGGYNLEIGNNGKWHRLEAAGLELSNSNTNAERALETNDLIKRLIVSSKAWQTVAALEPLKHRLSEKSTILFLQNGLGIIEAVNEQLFPDRATRPQYIIGVMWHGVSPGSPFNVTHTGFAATDLGLVPRADDTSPDPASCDAAKDKDETQTHPLTSSLCSIPRFNARSYSYTEILQIQLEKLAINALSNPVCALNDETNGFLATIPETNHQLMAEISAIVQAMPELQNVPGVKGRFSVEKLDRNVAWMVEKTFNATDSMVWDLRKRKKTEIDFLNGY